MNPYTTSPPLLNSRPLPNLQGNERLGSGVVTALLSRGGTALVYEIWNQQLEVKRAVKLLDPEHLEDALNRFETEIKISAKLHHPNIVEIFNVGTWNDLPYIEMERIDGFTLEELLARRGAFPLEVCTAIGIMIGKALNHAHNHDYMVFGKEYRGIIHRDLKPANIMVDKSSGVAKLMDFGIAKPVNASSKTMEGTVMGTMAYLAPEQLQGQEVDQRADLYSFGAVLSELLTGHKVFPEENLARLVTDKLSGNYTELSVFAIKCPAAIKRLLNKCLSLDRNRRMGDAAAIVRQLISQHKKLTDLSPEEVMRRYLAQQGVPKRSITLSRLRVPLLVVLQIVLIATLVGSGLRLWYLVSRNDPRTPAQALLPPVLEEQPTNSQPPSDPHPQPLPEGALPAVTQQAPRPHLAAPAPKAPTISSNSQPSAPPAVEAVSRPDTPPPQPSKSPMEQMLQRYGAATPGALLKQLAAKGDHAMVMTVWAALAPKDRQLPQNQILALRSYQAAAAPQRLNQFFTKVETPDSEFYGAKSLWLSARGDLANAKAYLDKCEKTAGAYMDPDRLEELRLNARATLASAEFAVDPSPQKRKEAMDVWYDIKLKYRSQPQNELYLTADRTIRSLAATSAAP